MFRLPQIFQTKQQKIQLVNFLSEQGIVWQYNFSKNWTTVKPLFFDLWATNTLDAKKHTFSKYCQVHQSVLLVLFSYSFFQITTSWPNKLASANLASPKQHVGRINQCVLTDSGLVKKTKILHSQTHPNWTSTHIAVNVLHHRYTLT